MKPQPALIKAAKGFLLLVIKYINEQLNLITYK